MTLPSMIPYGEAAINDMLFGEIRSGQVLPAITEAMYTER